MSHSPESGCPPETGDTLTGAAQVESAPPFTMNQRPFAVVAAIIAVFSVVVIATGAVPRAADDLLFDHISFGVADPARAAAWYAKNLGATPEGASGVAFGSIHLRFRQAATARPSAGSVVDHLGLAFTSLEAKVAELQAAGGTLSPRRRIRME